MYKWVLTNLMPGVASHPGAGGGGGGGGWRNATEIRISSGQLQIDGSFVSSAEFTLPC